MKREITHELSSDVRSQLDFLAKSLGKKAFFIQDTETTGTGDLDQIHDFAGLYYDNGKIYQIQYYVVQPDDVDENGFIHVNFDELKKANKNIAAFQNMISNKDYIKLRQEMLNKKTWNENDPMITRESLADLIINRYGRIPNFTYNAVFDIKMEKKLSSAVKSKIKFNEVYDVMTMSLDLMPDILSAQMGKELSKGRLEKVYKYLEQHYPKEFSKFKTAKTGAQTHTAWDDVFQYTVPVLNFMVHTLQERGFKISSYKDIQNVWHKSGLKGKQDVKEANLKIGLEFEDYFRKKGQDPKWAANALAVGEKNVLEVISIYNQLTLAEKKSKQGKTLHSDVVSPRRTTFRRVTAEQVMKNPELLSNMTIVPLKTGLNTDIYGIDDGTGHIMVARFHKSFFKNIDQAVAFGAEKIYSVSEIGSTLSQYLGKGTGESWATDFGTAHHRIIEDITNGKIARLKNGKVDEQTLKRYINDLWIKGSSEDRYDIKGMFDEFGRISDTSLTILNKTVNEFLKQAKELGIPPSAHAEHTLGARLNVDGKIINISGTIDQFWLMGKRFMLGDLKTSKEISPQYVIQLSLYRALLRATGRDVSKSLKIMLTPANVSKIGGVVDIESLSDKDLGRFIKQSVEALEEKDPEKQAKQIAAIQKKWIPKLETHIGKKMVTGTIVNEYGVEETRHFINGQSLGSIGEMLEKRIPATGYEKRYLDEYYAYCRKNPRTQLDFENFLRARISPQDYAKHLKFLEKRAKVVNDYINTITSASDRRHVRSLLNLRGEGNKYLYDNPVFDAYRRKGQMFKDPSNKRNLVLYDILDQHGNLNSAWLNEMIKVGALDKESGKSVTLGGLTARDWINLFKSTDLGFLNNGGLLTKDKLLKAQQRMLSAMGSQSSAYEKAINSLVNAILFGTQVTTIIKKGRRTDPNPTYISGLLNAPKAGLQVAEDYITLKRFSSAIDELIRSNNVVIPKNFITDLYHNYQDFATKQFKKISFSDYVRHHTDAKTIKTFEAYLEKRAVEKFCNLTGIEKISTTVASQEEQHVYDVITKSMNMHQDYVQEVERTKDALSQMYDEEEQYLPFDAPLHKTYDTYDPAKKKTIIGQLPHRVARMLTRKQLGDIVYKSMYQDYLKTVKSPGGKITYEDFLDYLTPEQYNEYKASEKLRQTFDSLIRKNKGKDFLITLAKSDFLGSDEESKNLHSLIKSIYQKDPSILSDPSIMFEIQQQVTGAKMEHYARFSAKKLAEMGLPLTLIGKPLNQNKGRDPYASFVQKYGTTDSNGALGLFAKSPLFKKGPEYLLKKLTKFTKFGVTDEQLEQLDVEISEMSSTLQDVAYAFNKFKDVDPDISEEDFQKSSLGRLVQHYNNLKLQYRSALKRLAITKRELRENQYDYTTITKFNKAELEEATHRTLKVGDRYLTYQLYKFEDEYNVNFAKKQILEAAQGIAKLYDILHYRAESWVSANAKYTYQVGEQTITLHGRDAIIYQLNKEVQVYMDELQERMRKEREDPTRAAHLALSKEEMEMAGNSETNKLLQQILETLQKPADTISGDSASVRASILGSSKVIDKKEWAAEKLLDEEMKKYGDLARAKVQLATAQRTRDPSVEQLRGVVKYLTEIYEKVVGENNQAYNMGSLSEMRKKRIAEFDLTTGNSMYQNAYNAFVKSEIEALREKDRINRQIIDAEKKGQKTVADFLRTTSLVSAEERYTTAIQQTNAFYNEHQGVNTSVKANMYADYAKEIKLKDSITYEKERAAAEKDYLQLINKEIQLKEQLTKINIQLKNVDPNSAEHKLLLSQRKDTNRDIKLTRGQLEALYSGYVDAYGINMIDGSALQTPREAVAGAAKESRYRIKNAEQQAALKEYNEALEQQVALYREIKTLEEQIQKARRKGDMDTVSILQGQLADKNSVMNMMSGTTKAAFSRVLKAYPKGKHPKGLKSFEQSIEGIDELFAVRSSESDFADYRQALGQYKALKKQEATLMDQLYRNDLKYKTTYNKKERGALDLQGSLLGMDLTEVQQQLAALEKASQGIKGFARSKADLDRQFNDIQAKNIANANVAFKGENTLFGKLTTSFKGMIYHFTQFGAAYKILGAVKQGISNVITSAKNLDKAMTDLRIVTGQTGTEAKNTMQRFSDLASQLGVTTNEVAKSATAWLRQGYDMAQVTDLVTSSLYLSKLGMISVDEATQGLTKKVTFLY